MSQYCHVASWINLWSTLLSKIKGVSPKLIFGNDLIKRIKETSETNKVGEILQKETIGFPPVGHSNQTPSHSLSFSLRGEPFCSKTEKKNDTDQLKWMVYHQRKVLQWSSNYLINHLCKLGIIMNLQSFS